MPLRLLRLLLKHGEELATEFDAGLARAPARAWRGVVRPPLSPQPKPYPNPSPSPYPYPYPYP